MEMFQEPPVRRLKTSKNNNNNNNNYLYIIKRRNTYKSHVRCQNLLPL